LSTALASFISSRVADRLAAGVRNLGNCRLRPTGLQAMY
jgi:hypothetical protein